MPFLRKLVRKKFCFCFSLTSGCIIVAFYTLFFGFINAGTTVDEVIYNNTLKTDVYAKWFNVFHIALMIAAAVILLVSVMTYLRIVFVWMAMFIIHMISYYIVFNALINVRNPFFESAVYAIIYVFVNLVTLGIDLFCVLKVYTYYYVKTHPDEFRPVCVDK
ncbi:uncharacterized protein LOC27208393 isoform X2 [Drosophila simulans]|uniref:Uncharacterized protein, isoform B n=1 Tax=Drosophila simulans TaxID=7240 RepID=A0A0J9RZP2_DROSI|nr:uncharacterized protein LOC27208393 isoform X2 [Drosophila simulans]KMZ00660.1 uncharacterized protein Dsimw501_GD28546, isoform B [Drosophila simulans]